MSWTLSCLQLTKYYGKVHLYCNSQCARLLIDKLQLPYTEVHISHDEKKFKMPHKELWAFSKIHTYSLQNSPFLHVDGDVYIFKPFPESLLRNKLIAQNEEVDSNYYEIAKNRLLQEFTYFPKSVRRELLSERVIKAVNAGILGGSDMCFFKEYSLLAKKYINRNVNKLPLIDVDKFNVFLEQHLFSAYARDKGKEIAYLFSNRKNRNQLEGIINFWEAPYKRHYIHLYGYHKKRASSCKLLSAMLRQYHPDFYYKIIALFKTRHLEIHNDCYHDLKDKTEIGLKAFFLSSSMAYASEQKKTASQPRYNQKNTPVKLIDNEKEFLRVVIDNIDYKATKFSKKEAEIDCCIFLNKLKEFRSQARSMSKLYLYGQEIDAINWYKRIFENSRALGNRIINQNVGIGIISSRFNWSLYLKLRIEFGKTMNSFPKLNEGDYYSVLVPETNERSYSIFDVDHIGMRIIEISNKPITIDKLFSKVVKYFSEDVIANDQKRVSKFIIELIKRLILYKAIKPSN